MEDLSLSLKVARRKSGLTERDAAHLSDILRSRISRFERGKARPDNEELLALALIYGQPVDTLTTGLLGGVGEKISGRLHTLKTDRGSWLGRFNRQGTLQVLSERLDRLSAIRHGR